MSQEYKRWLQFIDQVQYINYRDEIMDQVPYLGIVDRARDGQVPVEAYCAQIQNRGRAHPHVDGQPY